ncbi:MAG: hypothetical protein EOP49_49395 [Sphingobacteriales bacterium]|nr:MAG: hypothetical protein EOP49_49395 [Sphingobacteriales bacterium]
MKKATLIISFLICSVISFGQTIDQYKYTVDTSIGNKSKALSITKAAVAGRFKELADIVQREKDSSVNYGDTLGRIVARKQLKDTADAIRTTVSNAFANAILKRTAALDFPMTTAQTSAELTITFDEAILGDAVAIGVPASAAISDGSYSAYVSQAGVVTVRFNNYSSRGLNPSPGTFKVTILR